MSGASLKVSQRGEPATHSQPASSLGKIYEYLSVLTINCGQQLLAFVPGPCLSREQPNTYTVAPGTRLARPTV